MLSWQHYLRSTDCFMSRAVSDDRSHEMVEIGQTPSVKYSRRSLLPDMLDALHAPQTRAPPNIHQ